jgi:hypothetical protein
MGRFGTIWSSVLGFEKGKKLKINLVGATFEFFLQMGSTNENSFGKILINVYEK